jgi:hypothetical protein
MDSLVANNGEINREFSKYLLAIPVGIITIVVFLNVYTIINSLTAMSECKSRLRNLVSFILLIVLSILYIILLIICLMSTAWIILPGAITGVNAIKCNAELLKMTGECSFV